MNVEKVLRYLNQGWQKKGFLGVKNLIQTYRTLWKEPEVVSSEIFILIIEPICAISIVLPAAKYPGTDKKGYGLF